MKWNWDEFNKATAWGSGFSIGFGIAVAVSKALAWVVEAL